MLCTLSSFHNELFTTRFIPGQMCSRVVSHNTGRLVYKPHKSLIKSSPGVFCKLYERQSKRKSVSAAARIEKKPRVKRCLKMSSGKDNDDKSYRPSAQKPDIAKELYEAKSKKHMKKLNKTREEILQLEEATRD